MENETFRELFENASEQAIRVFAENLHHLLMQPPLTGQVVLGWDPGYRNGCKLAVVDATGRVLDTAVVYPTQPFNKIAETKRKVTDLLKKHKVTVISIGNGTASRESEKIVAELIAESGLPVQYAIVSEAGASVYSASKLASEEFPEYDVNLRSAVSIARRLQDPLAELVKIDPKAIGIGQYQHDMPPGPAGCRPGWRGGKLRQLGGRRSQYRLALSAGGTSPASMPPLPKILWPTGKKTAALLPVPSCLRCRSLAKSLRAVRRLPAHLRRQKPAGCHRRPSESYPIAEQLLTPCGCALTDIGTESCGSCPPLRRRWAIKRWRSSFPPANRPSGIS